MRIAVIGSGIAGNSAAWALATGSQHEVVVYEREARAGGHSATVDIDYDGTPLSVDTGFIVYNELNYPNLTSLFAHLGVETQASDMGFSVSAEGGRREWAGRTEAMIDGLFARRRNIVSLAHYRMIREMFRFNRQATADHHGNRLGGLTIGEYLDKGGYSAGFRDDYLVPMGAAIWSMPPARLLGFPAASFISFCENHRLLHWDRPTWRSVTGGSRAYVEKLVAPFRKSMRLGTAVAAIRRDPAGVTVTDAAGQSDRFDQIVLAAHSDQALAMLSDASPIEASVLGDIAYRPNEVWLHRDPALMPRRKAAWSAWNVLMSEGRTDELTLTYWMNALQGFDKRLPVFVTLNPQTPPRPELVFGRFEYSHPQYDRAALAAQAKLAGIQGRNRIWFAGAWTGHGFHEDGLKSGLTAAEALGASVPWRQPAVSLLEAEAAE
jgi:predicted NAD/FAD-binding protein